MFPVSNYCIVTCMPLVRKTSSGTLCLTICLRYWFFWCSSRSRKFSSLRAQTYSTVQYSTVQYCTVQRRPSWAGTRAPASPRSGRRWAGQHSTDTCTAPSLGRYYRCRRSPGPRPPLLGGVGQHGLGGQHGQPAGPRLLGPEDVADLDHGLTPDTALSLGRQSTSQWLIIKF